MRRWPNLIAGTSVRSQAHDPRQGHLGAVHGIERIPGAYTSVHKSPRILNFRVFDVAHFELLLRLAKARPTLLDQEHTGYGDGGGVGRRPTKTNALDEFTDFILGIRCMSHILSLATRWGLLPFSAKDIFHNVHIGIAALRNSGTELTGHIDEFRGSRLIYVPVVVDDAGIVARSQLWKLLLGCPMLADKFIAYGLWFDLVASAVHAL